MSNSSLFCAWLCGNCGWHTMENFAPPRCPQCLESTLEERELPREGTVYSSTTIYDAPAGYEMFAPYRVALIALPITLRNGSLVELLVTARLTEDCAIGTPVEHVTRKLTEDERDGLVTYGPMFQPRMRWERK